MRIRNGNIYLIRGDTEALKFTPYVNGKTLDSYTLTLSVKKTITDTDYVLQKTAVEDTFYFESADTNDLDAGTYVYDIELRSDGIVKTYGPHSLHLIADVTRG